MNASVQRRVIRCVKEIWAEYITAGEEYTFIFTGGTVYYSRTSNGASSYMSEDKFRKCLRDGSIIFVDNL